MAFELSLEAWVGSGPAGLKGKDLFRRGFDVREGTKL